MWRRVCHLFFNLGVSVFEGEEQAIHNSDESYHLCMMFKEKKDDRVATQSL